MRFQDEEDWAATPPARVPVRHARSSAQPPSPDGELGALVDLTLQRGFAMLRFPARLERRFVRETAAAWRRTLGISCTMGALAFSMMLLADWAMVPDVLAEAAMLRLGVFAPLGLLAAWWLKRHPRVFVQELVAVALCLLAAGLHAGLCLLSDSPQATAYLAGLAMVLLYWCVFVRVRFWLALPLAAGFMLGFAALWWLAPLEPFALVVPAALQLSTTAVFTVYARYVLEHEERHNYLLALRQRVLQHEWNVANERLEHMSLTDTLTQLANRRHFDDFLTRTWRRAAVKGSRVSVLMLDVDHFKGFNDRYGHPAGDRCLSAVGRCLRDIVGGPRDLAARYGGEEFVAVLPDLDIRQAQRLAERVRSAIQGLGIEHEASTPFGVVTASIGIATLAARSPGGSPARLLALADAALYRAKDGGRNRVMTEPRYAVSERRVSNA